MKGIADLFAAVVGIDKGIAVGISILIAGFQDFNLMLYIAIGLFKVEMLEPDEEISQTIDKGQKTLF